MPTLTPVSPTVYVADQHTGEIVARADSADITNAKRYPGTLLVYRCGDAWSHNRCGFLARLYRDERGNEFAVELTDEEIGALS